MINQKAQISLEAIILIGVLILGVIILTITVVNTSESNISRADDLDSQKDSIFNDDNFEEYNPDLDSISDNLCVLELSSSLSNEGTVNGAGSFKCGSLVNISAIPNDGHTFDNWKTSSGNVFSNYSNFSFILSQDLSLIANFN